ncbi:MAG: hypothetical protein J6A79_17825 [Clostridia bacterium]|nr:hypothetical protein [Clostridia bacterium]
MSPIISPGQADCQFLSVAAVLFLDEVGGLILGSELPINLWKLFLIFLERTIISLLIVCPLAHLIFA